LLPIDPFDDLLSHKSGRTVRNLAASRVLHRVPFDHSLARGAQQPRRHGSIPASYRRRCGAHL